MKRAMNEPFGGAGCSGLSLRKYISEKAIKENPRRAPAKMGSFFIIVFI
jgi:hypothetical protein